MSAGSLFLRIDNVLVILVCTLAGGMDRMPWGLLGYPESLGERPASAAPPGDGNHSCPAGSVQWRDCVELDATIHPVHLFSPWVCAFVTVVVLGMPTVLLRSRTKEKGLRLFTGILVQFISLLACGMFMSGHPAVSFVFALHAAVRFLVGIDGAHVLVGGVGWWRLRYLAVGLILGLQLAFGPPVSVVHWPGAGGVSCAYLCHLVGCVAPDFVLSGVRCLIAFARYVHIRDD